MASNFLRSWKGISAVRRTNAFLPSSPLPPFPLIPIHPASYCSSSIQGVALSPLNNSDLGRKIFTQHVIYKGKGAMCLRPGNPTFRRLTSGDMALTKEGCLFVEFACAVGQKQYDWKKKKIFALSVLELGTLVGLQSTNGCEFFHDPHMGSDNAGKIKKTLKVEPLPNQSGFFFSFSYVNKIDKTEEYIRIPVSQPEMTVLRSSFNVALCGVEIAKENHLKAYVKKCSMCSQNGCGFKQDAK